MKNMVSDVRAPGRTVLTVRSTRRLDGFTPYLFLLPALIVYSVIVVYPILNSLWLTMFQWDGVSPDKKFVGFSNFIYIFTEDPVFYIALKNNLKWSVASLLLPVSLGLGFALLFSKAIKGFSFFRGAVYFPATLSLVIIGTIWTWMYDPNFGLINNALQLVSGGHASFDWFAKPNNTIFFVVLAASWSYSGICMLMFMSGLQAISREIYESALIDGATRFRKLVHITLPLLKNTLNVVLVTTLVNSFQVFDIIFTMTNGGPGRATNVLASWSYAQVFTYHDMGRGTAIAWVLSIIVLSISILSNRISSKNDY
ncbi:sugar ABC transporter permease [Paenibacillus sp. LC231]|uniref:carbohydrate ABC transporter permease n=1 Tax=Paenibacillus sp. LC231 TaxID=1120679 RepID=UPI0009F73585|nr:sugar ABC transporter permease [Paenibacillus sp. LC231]